MKVKRPAATMSQIQDTSDLSHQCSATDPQQTANPHNPLYCTGGTECLSRTPAPQFIYFQREVRSSEDLSRSTFQSSNPIGQYILHKYNAHMRHCPNNTLNKP